MVTKEFKEACTEINEIFKFLDKSKVEKIPYELRNTFNKFQSREYVTHINPSKPLEEQELTKKTKDILVELYVKYWCSDEDREEVNKILSENYEKKQLELRKKYNPDEIFKNKSKKQDELQENSLMQYKESIFKRIINKISKFFSK